MTESIAGRGETGGDTRRSPGPRCTSTATGNKYQGLDDGAEVVSKWDRAEGAGIA